MNTLKQIFERYGLTLADAVKAGCPYHALYKQLKGERTVGVVCALRYHKVLGIPLSELRPDIWPDHRSAESRA